jgi:hypothetical protein
MKLGETPPRDLALLAVAVLLMVGGAVTLVGGWIAAGIAVPRDYSRNRARGD